MSAAMSDDAVEVIARAMCLADGFDPDAGYVVGKPDPVCKESLQTEGDAEHARMAEEIARLKRTLDTVREALTESRDWHERQRKALSKSGRSDHDAHWMRSEHWEQTQCMETALFAMQTEGERRGS